MICDDTGASTGGTDLISCQNVTNSPADYCCDHTNGCCDSGVGRFQILPSSAVTSAVWISSATAFSDLSRSTGTSTETGTRSRTHTTFPATKTAAASSTNTPQSSSGGLSTGAQAGIGVGAAVGALLVLGAIGFFFWRRRQSSRKYKPTAQSEETFYDKDHKIDSGYPAQQRSELPGEREMAQAPDVYARPAELDPQVRYELGAETAELDGDRPKR